MNADLLRLCAGVAGILALASLVAPVILSRMPKRPSASADANGDLHFLVELAVRLQKDNKPEAVKLAQQLLDAMLRGPA